MTKKLNNVQWQQLLQKLDEVIYAFETSIVIFARYQLEKNTFDETDYGNRIKQIIIMRDSIRDARKKLPKYLLERNYIK